MTLLPREVSKHFYCAADGFVGTDISEAGVKGEEEKLLFQDHAMVCCSVQKFPS